MLNKKNLPLGARSGLLHSGVEVGVAEELQGARENHSGVIPGLQAGDQQGVLADSMRILERKSTSFTIHSTIHESFLISGIRSDASFL